MSRASFTNKFKYVQQYLYVLIYFSLKVIFDSSTGTSAVFKNIILSISNLEGKYYSIRIVI